MKLFDENKVKKFFDILYTMKRSYPVGGDIYMGYDRNNPTQNACQQEVFVSRTVNKWLRGRYLMLYCTDNQLEIQYKKYISISNIYLRLGYTNGELIVVFYDYAKPYDIVNKMSISINDAIGLEGIWCNDRSDHLRLSSMFEIDEPGREFIFKAYDLSSSEDENTDINHYETTHSIFAKTHIEAFKIKRRESNKDFIICDLISVI